MKGFFCSLLCVNKRCKSSTILKINGVNTESVNLFIKRPVGKPRRTWLESVESDMAELEIDKEDVHDRKKWRGSPTLSENGV